MLSSFIIKRGRKMKFSDAMIFYGYSMSKIARALNVTRHTISRWRDDGQIPLNRQCELEVITNGALKADVNNKRSDCST